MLAPIFGSATREKVFLFLLVREKGYAREIAGFFGISLNQIQKQMDGLEVGGVLVSSNRSTHPCMSSTPVILFWLS